MVKEISHLVVEEEDINEFSNFDREIEKLAL